MGIIRLIILLLLAYLIWRLYQSTRQALAPRPPAQTQGTPRMVKCLHCGIHVPESDATWVDDRSFCSEEHQRAWLEHDND